MPFCGLESSYKLDKIWDKLNEVAEKVSASSSNPETIPEPTKTCGGCRFWDNRYNIKFNRCAKILATYDRDSDELAIISTSDTGSLLTAREFGCPHWKPIKDE